MRVCPFSLDGEHIVWSGNFHCTVGCCGTGPAPWYVRVGLPRNVSRPRTLVPYGAPTDAAGTSEGGAVTGGFAVVEVRGAALVVTLAVELVVVASRRGTSACFLSSVAATANAAITTAVSTPVAMDAFRRRRRRCRRSARDSA